MCRELNRNLRRETVCDPRGRTPSWRPLEWLFALPAGFLSCAFIVLEFSTKSISLVMGDANIATRRPWRLSVSAMPSDVRRRLCPAARWLLHLGYALRPPWAQSLQASSNPGQSPKCSAAFGGAQPPPHIRRHNRERKGAKSFV